MDFIIEYGEQIAQWLTSVSAFIVSVTMFVKSLKSETRVFENLKAFKDTIAAELTAMDTKVNITRAGIVQGFKEAVVTKDVKVSVNKQVEKIINEKMDALISVIVKNEEKRTKMTYWALKIIRNTAAADKLTVEQQSEVDEVMAMIKEDETIIDTIS